MKILSIILCCVSGCLSSSGCILPPMSAHDMFGTSNPTAKVNFPRYGSMEIPTNAKIRMKIEDNPDGTGKIDFTMASDAAAVDVAEGGRISPMESQRNAYTEATVESAKISYQFWGGVVHDIAPGLLSFLNARFPAPLPGPPAPEVP